MYYTNELYHHGIQGMHWGERRFQNPDGTYTAAGRARYGIGTVTKNGKYRATNGVVIARSKNAGVAAMRRFGTTLPGRALSAAGRGQMAKITGRSKESLKAQEKREREAFKEYFHNGGDKMLDKGKLRSPEEQAKIDKRNKALKTAAVVAGAAAITAGLAVYGAKKLDDKAVMGLSKKYSALANEHMKSYANDKRLAEGAWQMARAAEVDKRMDLADAYRTGGNIRIKRANDHFNAAQDIQAKILTQSFSKAEKSDYLKKAAKAKASAVKSRAVSNVTNRTASVRNKMPYVGNWQVGSNTQISGKAMNQIVSQYKKLHPGTNLSPQAIIANYYRI